MRRHGRLTLLVLVAAAGLAAVSLRTQRRREALPALLLVETPGVELRLRADMAGGGDRAFQQALTRFVEALRGAGVRVDRVLPDPGSASVEGAPLDDARVARAVGGLPLVADPVAAAAIGGAAGLRVVVRLAPDAGAGMRDAALQQTAVALRERALASPLCRRCARAEVTVEVDAAGDGELLVHLPWMDDATERRLVDELLAQAPPLPARLTLAGRRVIAGGAPVPSPGL